LFGNIKNFETAFVLLTGLIFSFIYSRIYAIGRKKAVEIFKKQFPNEEIVYVIQENELAKNLITFAIGGFFGMLVLVLIFQDIYSLGKINDSNIYFYILIFIISALGLIVRYTMTYIISNKRIQAIFPTKIKYNKKHCLIEDIEAVKINNTLGIQTIIIKMKDGSIFQGLDIFGHIKEIKDAIENIKNKEK